MVIPARSPATRAGVVDGAQGVEQLLPVADARDERQAEHECDDPDSDDEDDGRARDGRPSRRRVR